MTTPPSTLTPDEARAEAAWAILDTALRRHARTGAAYAAVPTYLVERVFGLTLFPLSFVADDRCATLDVDDAGEASYVCLLPAGHAGDCPHLLTMATVADAVAAGYRPELDDVDLDLDDDLSPWLDA